MSEFRDNSIPMGVPNTHPDSLCICGHVAIQHYSSLTWCETCFYTHSNTTQWQHNFQLDNLSYIEQLAKEKNLI
jgi:hypothetical protein